MKSRITAFAIHLALSITFASISLFIIFFIWYPTPLQDALGVKDIYLILLAVDVSLGPILTFVIYIPKKKYLWLDLWIIALLQISALGYGVYTIFQGRPAYIVFSKDRFETVSPIDIAPKDMETALANKNKYAEASWLMPQWIAVTQSKDEDRRKEILFSSVLGGADWPQLPELYTSLTEVKVQLINKSKSLNELMELYNQSPDIIKKLQKYDSQNVKWLPLKSNAKNMIVLINASTSKVIEIVDINPWP